MCCRFYLRNTDPELSPIIEKAANSPILPRFEKVHPAPLVDSGEVYPTDLVPVIASNRKREETVFPMIWGIPGFKKSPPLINARVETASEKESFREAWKKHRCAVPASWYYEWKQIPAQAGKAASKEKYAIRALDARVTFLCGLYQMVNGLPFFVILASEASESVAHIHKRMPVVLPVGAIREWINPGARPDWLLKYQLTMFAAEREA